MCKKYRLVLASGSPRRQQLLLDAGFLYEIRLKDTEEVYPETLKVKEVPEYLSRLKASAFHGELADDELLITADTAVILGNEVLGKPHNYDAAVRMLEALSGQKHTVVTGVCLTTNQSMESYSVMTDVYFRKLDSTEITWYVDKYKPYDKAGAYGIQEWIGYVGIEKIEGSFYNVMGLPIQTLYSRLKEYGLTVHL